MDSVRCGDRVRTRSHRTRLLGASKSGYFRISEKRERNALSKLDQGRTSTLVMSFIQLQVN